MMVSDIDPLNRARERELKLFDPSQPTSGLLQSLSK